MRLKQGVPIENNRAEVICFIRSPIRWGAKEAQWLSAKDGEKPDLNTRTNILRLLAAAELATARGCSLWLVEGWRIHSYERPNGTSVLLRGSAMGGMLLRALRREGLLDILPVLRLKPRSRCTVQEVDAFMAEAQVRGEVIAVAGPSCPSACRMARLFRRRHGIEVQSVSIAEKRAVLELLSNDKQKKLALKCFPSTQEQLINGVSEGVNWGLHLISELLRPVLGFSLELRLATKLRQDKAQS